MSSYETIQSYRTPVTGTMYVQPAPWTEEIVLKVMTGSNYNLQTVRIPVNVETDSIKIYLNEDNDNYVVTEDGTRTPLTAAQTMADMRSNVARGPDCASTIINDLTDMKEAGINYLSSTIAFGYDTTKVSQPIRHGRQQIHDGRRPADGLQAGGVQLLPLQQRRLICVGHWRNRHQCQHDRLE